MESYHLPKLEYQPQDLKDFITEHQFDCHYNQHHKKYIDKLNELLQKNNIQESSLIKIISDEDSGELFNQAAQAWNHTFFWYSISPEKNSIEGRFLEKLEESDFSIDDLKNSFIDKGMSVFGSGWVWIVLNNKNKIEVMSTRNAKTPFFMNYTPLVVADVWEHAYYLDYESARRDYLEKFWNHINWGWVEKFLEDKQAIHLVERLMK